MPLNWRPDTGDEMSFSQDVKKELGGRISSSMHCRLAEILAILLCNAVVVTDSSGSPQILLRAGDTTVTRKFFTLCKKTFNIDVDVLPAMEDQPIAGSRMYEAVMFSQSDSRAVLSAVRILDESGGLRSARDGINQVITKNSCCKRAFLRDTFLCIGSMSDPGKAYHLEFVCDEEAFAGGLCGILKSLGINGKRVVRGHSEVVYIKESAEISELLALMEAPVALMQMENERIVREMRGNVNRRVNCEAANISRTVDAATRQIEDIRFLEEHGYLSELPESLREIAMLRLQNPDATLTELGELLDPPVGKSGVNHRLRRLQMVVEKYK